MYAGYYWRGEYQDKINVPAKDNIKRVAVLAFMPDGTTRQYKMIKEAAKELHTSTASVHHSIKTQHKTKQGIVFQRI